MTVFPSIGESRPEALSQESQEGGGEGDLSEATQPSQSKSKTKRKFVSINDNDTGRLIEWIKVHRMLWDKSDPNYSKKAQDKMFLWDEACRFLNITKLATGEAVATEWKNIRDIFVKMDKDAARSGSGVYTPAGHRRQLICQQANFLSGNIIHSGKRENVRSFSWDTRGDNLPSSQKSLSQQHSSSGNLANLETVSNISSCPASPPPEQTQETTISTVLPPQLTRRSSVTSADSVTTGKLTFCTLQYIYIEITSNSCILINQNVL